MISVMYVIGKKGKVLYSKEIRKHGSAAIFLDKDENEYPILSEITAFDIERYFPEEMNDLILELNQLKKSLFNKSDVSYINEIIELCQQCQNNNEGQIIFDPFTNLVKIGEDK